MGERLLARPPEAEGKHACIGDVRGRGTDDGRGVREGPAHPGARAGELVHDLVQRAFQQGLLLLGAGKSTLRLAPPLVVDEQDVDTALGRCIDGLPGPSSD